MRDRFGRLAPPASSVALEVISYEDSAVDRREDRVTAEEPLEIRVVREVGGKPVADSLAITMRTPGGDFELATGFLVSEGVVRRADDIWRVAYCESAEATEGRNTVEVYLAPHVAVDLGRLTRHVIMSSACGICGKASIESVEAICRTPPRGEIRVAAQTLVDLPRRLQMQQPVFTQTGGLHAAGLFDEQGVLLARREDVGRHNALDKLVGSLLDSRELPASNRALLLSGRISFELVQKALLAGIPFVAAVGAPSSLAVELADSYGMTVVGFLRGGRFNVYCGERRLILPDR